MLGVHQHVEHYAGGAECHPRVSGVLAETQEMNDIKERFEAIARGRSVSVAERANTLFNNDFEVAYEGTTNSYRVEFTRNGWFEEAYRFIERWIKRHAEEQDGVHMTVPAGHVDCRGESLFWIVERFADCYIGDCCTALENAITTLERERPNEGVPGEITVESRVKALRGFLVHVRSVLGEVHSAVLSPRAIEFLSVVGLDCFGPKRDSQPSGRGDSGTPQS